MTATLALKPDPALIPRAPTTKSAADLMAKEFDPIAWLVPGLIPEGLMILAARPKIGKSWLALDLAIATSAGGTFLGRPVAGGEVLYLGLEDSDRRMAARLSKLGASGRDLRRLEYSCEWPRGEFGAFAVGEWLEAHPAARLVVVDVFAKMREASPSRETGYGTDYADVAMLKPQRPGVTVLLVHHSRKADSEDAIDSVSGTLGIGGAADGVLVLKRARGESEAELHLIGRDLEEEGQFSVRFDRDTCRWQWLGDAWMVKVSAERRQAFDLLAAKPMKPHELAKDLGKTQEATRMLVSRMVQDGLIDRGMDGRYRVIGGRS